MTLTQNNVNKNHQKDNFLNQKNLNKQSHWHNINFRSQNLNKQSISYKIEAKNMNICKKIQDKRSMYWQMKNKICYKKLKTFKNKSNVKDKEGIKWWINHLKSKQMMKYLLNKVELILYINNFLQSEWIVYYWLKNIISVHLLR